MRSHEILVLIPAQELANQKIALALAILMLVAVALYDRWPKWR